MGIIKVSYAYILMTAIGCLIILSKLVPVLSCAEYYGEVCSTYYDEQSQSEMMEVKCGVGREEIYFSFPNDNSDKTGDMVLVLADATLDTVYLVTGNSRLLFSMVPLLIAFTVFIIVATIVGNLYMLKERRCRYKSALHKNKL